MSEFIAATNEEVARRPTPSAIRKLQEWLHFCRHAGWKTSQMSALCDMWWYYHDDNGKLIEKQESK